MASSKRDKALLAEITGVARRLARGQQLSEAEQQEAAATLSQVARGRADLLAEAPAWPSALTKAARMRRGICRPPSSASKRGPTSA